MDRLTTQFIQLEGAPELNFHHEDIEEWNHGINFLSQNVHSFGISLNILEQLKQSLLTKIIKCEDFIKRKPDIDNDVLVTAQRNIQFYNHYLNLYQLRINNLLIVNQ